MVEELFAADPSVALRLLSNALGLVPLIASGTEAHQMQLLKPFVGGEGAPLASLGYSKPGESASFFQLGARGTNTTATQRDDDWGPSGEKVRLEHATSQVHSRAIPLLSSATPVIASINGYELRAAQAGMEEAQTYDA